MYNDLFPLVHSETELSKVNPIYLGIQLNYSVFWYEVMGDAKKACNIAQKTFDEALSLLDDQDPENFKDASTIL